MRKADLWDEPTAEELAELAAEQAEFEAARAAEQAEADAMAALALWDYEVDERGRVRFAA